MSHPAKIPAKQINLTLVPGPIKHASLLWQGRIRLPQPLRQLAFYIHSSTSWVTPKHGEYLFSLVAQHCKKDCWSLRKGKSEMGISLLKAFPKWSRKQPASSFDAQKFFFSLLPHLILSLHLICSRTGRYKQLLCHSTKTAMLVIY